MNPKIRPTQWVMLVLAVAIAGAGLGRVLYGHKLPMEAAPVETSGLPILGTVADFKLIERSGKPVTPASLKGRVWIADFIFTYCAGPCPIMSTTMGQLQTAPSRERDVMLVSISVDPTRDTPEVLRGYAEKYGADPHRWWFLTGTPDEIRHVAVEGFRLGSVDDPILHSTYFTLVDGQGRIRAYYDSAEPGLTRRVTLDVERLQRESRQ